MTKYVPLPESARIQAHSTGTSSDFARKTVEAGDILVKMLAQERSIRDSIRDSSKAIRESRILLMELDTD